MSTHSVLKKRVWILLPLVLYLDYYFTTLLQQSLEDTHATLTSNIFSLIAYVWIMVFINIPTGLILFDSLQARRKVKN